MTMQQIHIPQRPEGVTPSAEERRLAAQIIVRANAMDKKESPSWLLRAAGQDRKPHKKAS